MTLKIKLLSAVALLGLPAAAGAQAPTPQPPGTTMENVNQTVQQAQDRNPANPPAGEQVADEQPRQAEQTPPQPAQQPPVTQDDAPPAPAGTQRQPPAGTRGATCWRRVPALPRRCCRTRWRRSSTWPTS